RDALLALAEMPGFPEAAEAIVRALRDPQTADDPWLVQAAAAAAARSDRYFFAAARATEKAETSNALARVAAVVAEHYARGGEHDDLAALLTALAAADTASADAAVAGLAKGWPKTDVKDAPKDLSVALGKLIVKLSPAGQLQLAGLAKRWGAGAQFAELTAKLTEALTETLADESKPDEARIAAAKQLVATTDDAKRLAPLLDLLTPRASPALVEGLIDALGESRSDGVAAALVDALAQLAPAARRRAIGLVLSRPSWTTALLAAMENGKAAVEDLAIDQRQQLAQHPDSALRARATKILERGGGLPNPDRQKVLDQFLPIARQRGDAAIGKKVYMDQCAKCHRHGSEGTSIGPDLTGMAAHPRAELLGHILDPNRSVEGNFRVYQVLTNDGRAVVGLLLGETRTAVELVDAEAKKQVVLREEIDRMIATRMSLMPEGFEKIGQKDLTNLLEFLSARGKYFALPLNKAANVVSTRPGMFQPGQPDYERLVFSQWGPHTVRGVPFHVIDPQGDRVPNAIVLFSPRNEVVKAYPKSVKIACNGPAKALHFLSGVSGWGFPFDRRKTVSLIVRLHYADGKAEDHELQNGVHFADFSYAADVPESKAALKLRGQQLRYFSITPRRDGEIASLELVKGDDLSAPVVMAVTVESP
ncbi:MAG: c-type cytochrome, partial [Pirellulales bacterium]